MSVRAGQLAASWEPQAPKSTRRYLPSRWVREHNALWVWVDVYVFFFLSFLFNPNPVYNYIYKQHINPYITRKQQEGFHLFGIFSVLNLSSCRLLLHYIFYSYFIWQAYKLTTILLSSWLFACLIFIVNYSKLKTRLSICEAGKWCGCLFFWTLGLQPGVFITDS